MRSGPNLRKCLQKLWIVHRLWADNSPKGLVGTKTDILYNPRKHFHSSVMAEAKITPSTDEQRKSLEIELGEKVRNFGELNVVSEGNVEVLFPTAVFYNPVQEFNRDVSIAVITQYAKEHFRKLYVKEEKLKEKLSQNMEQDANMSDMVDCVPVPSENELVCGRRYENGLRIFEGLAATGLRSVRFGLEIPGVKEVIANDYSHAAVEMIKENIKRNNLDEIVKSSFGDAGMIMYQNRGPSNQFDVIDLDPYGSPATFLDAAVQAIKPGGLLCVTCTDTAVLCGNGSETCYSKYGAMSLRSKFCHEMALRIVLQSIESHANRYSRYIVPILSLSIDFYVRIFVRVFYGQGKVKQSVSKMAMVYHCVGCGSYELQRLGICTPTKGGSFKYSPASGPPVGQTCRHCGFKHHVGGPIWAEPMIDSDFVGKVIENVSDGSSKLNTSNRIIGMLNMCLEELPDVPLYYVTDELCKVVHSVVPNQLQMRSAILNAGYRVSHSHATKNSVKTDSPNELIWDILRHWVRDGHPVNPNRLKDGMAAKNILNKDPVHNISFDIHENANPPSRMMGLVRYQVNPEKDWGPKARAKVTENSADNLPDKRVKNQNKRSVGQDTKERDLKQFPCKRHKDGVCDKGDNCQYSHDISSAVPGASEEPME